MNFKVRKNNNMIFRSLLVGLALVCGIGFAATHTTAAVNAPVKQAPCSSSSNPYDTAPGVPVGPVYCPPGYDLDNDCVKLAAEAYEAAVAQLYSDASDSYKAICGNWADGLATCLSNYNACIANGGTDPACLNSYIDCVQSGLRLRDRDLSTLATETSAKVAQAVADYWKAAEECCYQEEQ